MKRKKIKKIIANAILYTINARNVDRLYSIWVYAKYDLLGGSMEINKIKILATEYEVEEVEQIDKYERLLGQINYEEQRIKIDKSISEDMKKETLIHELLHGILEKLGYTDLNEDEQKVHSIASTMYLVLKENKLISF